MANVFEDSDMGAIPLISLSPGGLGPFVTAAKVTVAGKIQTGAKVQLIGLNLLGIPRVISEQFTGVDGVAFFDTTIPIDTPHIFFKVPPYPDMVPAVRGGVTPVNITGVAKELPAAPPEKEEEVPLGTSVRVSVEDKPLRGIKVGMFLPGIIPVPLATAHTDDSGFASFTPPNKVVSFIANVGGVKKSALAKPPFYSPTRLDFPGAKVRLIVESRDAAGELISQPLENVKVAMVSPIGIPMATATTDPSGLAVFVKPTEPASFVTAIGPVKKQVNGAPPFDQTLIIRFKEDEIKEHVPSKFPTVPVLIGAGALVAGVGLYLALR